MKRTRGIAPWVLALVLASSPAGSVAEGAGEPEASADSLRIKPSLPHRPSNWQLGGGGAGTLSGAGWSATVAYERSLDPARSLVARGEFVRVLDRGGEIVFDYSIPEWQVEGTDRFTSPDAWVNSYAICVGGRSIRQGHPVHAYIESSFGPAVERSRGKTRVSALVGVAGGAMLQPRRLPVGGFAELRMGLLVSESGILVTGRAGLLYQRR